ncbi:MAG: rcc01693 family protein [Microgenomates group bacterium]|jgi:uncharacterized phage protein (TIGR02216 family)
MRIDWSGLMQMGLGHLALHPGEFWSLTPIELRIMLGVDKASSPITRHRLEELSQAFPDVKKDADHGGY